jgi:glyoxylase-like metal-dependent hydrolase (beta-lactamase superfamily II)
MHNDHAFANEVFPEATVVGPTVGNTALREEVGRIPELLGRLEGGQEDYKGWAAESSPDSTDGKHAREGLAAFSVGIADLKAGIEPRYPSVTFDGHHTMHVGDIRLELFQFPGLHSEADILILVPEERTLFTGDVFWGGQLPIMGIESKDDFLRLLENWKTILEMSPDLEYVVPGHSDVPLSVEEFRGMYSYLHRLWTDVREARAAETALLRFMRENLFQERYPEVADFNRFQMDYNLHQHNIYVMWGFAEG